MAKKLKDDELCTVCGSNKNVEFIQITHCNLCEECDNNLAESFEIAMTEDRSGYPEL